MPKSIPETGSTSKSESLNVKANERKKVFISVSQSTNPRSFPDKPNNHRNKNIGMMSQRQLKDKIFEVSNKKRMPTTKRNRNGKVGINKENDYKFIPNAPRKTCFTCGNSNHLAIDCRKSKKKIKTIPESDIRNRSIFYKPQNSCFHCGSKWHSIYTCNEYHSLYHNFYDPLPKFNKSFNLANLVSILKSIYHLILILAKQFLMDKILTEKFLSKRLLLLRLIRCMLKEPNKCGFLKILTSLSTF